MGKERQAWLDYVRFFSIFLVIVFHTPPRLPLFDDAVILNLRVPVFFCISGFLYSIDRWSSFGQYAFHRAKQIIVPYCSFFVIFYALWLLVGRRMMPSEQSIDVLLPVQELLLGDPKVIVAPFWYIACLFSMQLIYYWIERLVPPRWVMASCMGMALLTYGVLESPFSCEQVSWWRFWNIGNAMMFLPFYALGNRFRQHLNKLSFSGKGNTLLYLFMAAVSMYVMVWIAPLQTVDYPLYLMLRVPAGFMVIPLYFAIGKWLATRFGRNRVIEFVVVSGTVYLGFQNYFIAIIKFVLERYLSQNVMDDNVWLKLVVPMLVMMLVYPCAWFIDRYCPWLIGKSKSYTRQ